MEKEIGDARVLNKRGKNESERKRDRQTEGEREREKGDAVGWKMDCVGLKTRRDENG